MICPQCKVGTVVERRNKQNGQPFWGCSSYPSCRFAAQHKPHGAEPVLSSSNAEEGDLAAAVRDLASAIRMLAGIRDELKPDGDVKPGGDS